MRRGSTCARSWKECPHDAGPDPTAARSVKSRPACRCAGTTLTRSHHAGAFRKAVSFEGLEQHLVEDAARKPAQAFNDARTTRGRSDRPGNFGCGRRASTHAGSGPGGFRACGRSFSEIFQGTRRWGVPCFAASGPNSSGSGRSRRPRTGKRRGVATGAVAAGSLSVEAMLPRRARRVPSRGNGIRRELLQNFDESARRRPNALISRGFSLLLFLATARNAFRRVRAWPSGRHIT